MEKLVLKNKICKKCKIKFEDKSFYKKQIFCSFKCSSLNNIEIHNKNVKNNYKLSGNYKNGKIIVDGYIYIMNKKHPNKTKDDYVCEHILIMEDKIKRYLNNNEIIHHIDKNKMNNNIENLQLMTISEHHKLHYKERIIDKRGRFVGSDTSQ